MTTKAVLPNQSRNKNLPIVVLIAGWVVPGLGHLLLRKYIRAGLLFVSIVTLFAAGLAMGGKLYATGTGDMLDLLGVVADAGNPLLYLVGRMLDWGNAPVLLAVAEYGTKFVAVAGLLNVIAAVDAHSLANGRKAGL
jgi:hypothetical protein